MKTLLVTGGCTDINLLKDIVSENKDIIKYGADSGLAAYYKANILPDYAIGDFDSLSKEYADYYLEEVKVPVVKLKPEKDLTDTHEALVKLLDMNPEEIIILGATGTRVDHMLANVSVLKLACDKGIDAFIIDKHNKIRVIKKSITIMKSEQYGKFVSVIPLGDKVTGLTMKGFKYGTDKVTITQGISLGVSNEIIDDIATIDFEEGYLIVLETRD